MQKKESPLSHTKKIEKQKMDYKSRLIRFFEKHNPYKLDSVDRLLESYQGQEDALFQALVNKYGPEPSPTDQDGGDDDDINSSSKSKPATSPEEKKQIAARLSRFYQKYAPEKVGTVDNVVEKYEGLHDKLFEALVHAYGPEPEVEQQEEEYTLVSVDPSDEPCVDDDE